jgi:Na+/H+ antiporter NhaD/arsenite permease-like protein
MLIKIRNFLRQEYVLFLLLVLFIILTALLPGYISDYHRFIDWKTITTLLALIIVATGIKESGYFDFFARKILAKIYDERTLAIFLVSLSAGLSTFLTNDITLFIVVPLTACMQKALKNDLVKTVIFEAIAVNVGSTLTPIGNPQNIFIWNNWGISFAGFILKMAPLVALMASAMYIAVFIVFKPHKLHFNAQAGITILKKRLGILSFGLMAAFLIALQFKAAVFTLPFIALVYLIFNRKVLFDVDWLLIATFILMFIDFALLAKLRPLSAFAGSIDMSKSRNVFAGSALLSQFISNVPASIFISKFSVNWQAMAYGADVAGNGTIIGSLANIIALRLLKPKSPFVWVEFHKYSVPFFLVTAGIVWLAIK